jgi:hypothetical protein
VFERFFDQKNKLEPPGDQPKKRLKLKKLSTNLGIKEGKEEI